MELGCDLIGFLKTVRCSSLRLPTNHKPKDLHSNRSLRPKLLREALLLLLTSSCALLVEICAVVA